MASRAVSISTGVRSPAWRMRRHTSRPSTCGMAMSSTTASSSPAARRASASRPRRPPPPRLPRGVRLLRDPSPGRPALDIALSSALLVRVARGELGPTVRLYRPGPTLAFGRLDALRPGFAEAGEAARDAGFEPIVRLAGGPSRAYDQRSPLYRGITPGQT